MNHVVAEAYLFAKLYELGMCIDCCNMKGGLYEKVGQRHPLIPKASRYESHHQWSLRAEDPPTNVWMTNAATNVNIETGGVFFLPRNIAAIKKPNAANT